MTTKPIDAGVERSPESGASETCRAVVLTIANHLLALPLTAVLKVVPKSAAIDFAENQPVVYLENQPLTLLNLHPPLSTVPSNNPAPASNVTSGNVTSGNATSGQLLLIAGLQGYSQWAIPVDQPPTLMELPLSTVRLLPIAYRQRIQNLACHVAVLSGQHELQTILLLNLKQAAELS